MIVGVTGKLHHGKDTIAEVLVAECGFNRIAFADKLKFSASRIFRLHFEQCYGDLKEVVDPRYQQTPRRIFQQYGTEVARSIWANIWVENVFADIADARAGTPIIVPDFELRAWVLCRFEEPEHWVIPDLRFFNEADGVHAQEHGFVVRVFRPGQPDDDKHASEVAVPLINAQYDLLNDKTVADLWAQALSLPFVQRAARAKKTIYEVVGE